MFNPYLLSELAGVTHFWLAGLAVVLLLMCTALQAGQAAAGGENISPPRLETATFAAGCFWGVEYLLRAIPGVVRTTAGYTGGTTSNPTYREVCAHTTGHAEAVRVEYDPERVSYQKLLELFFEQHDPTTLNRQGPDIGDQYRSAVFYHTPEQERLAQAEKDKRDRSGEYAGPLVTQIVPAGPFYPAEEYHQQYYQKQGLQGACHFGNGKKKQKRRP